MPSLNTPNEFIEALKSIGSQSNNNTPKKYRYVIYVRKSTDEKEKQVRSLPDQIIECKEFAEKNDLNWIDVISESESAKEPDIRPKFREMLRKLNEGKYDGIIAWHPDRLARNMKDAGEIIDLLDKDIIQDLKFASFSFSNDTAGKMLLGITFVLSKEYSDKLSDDVSRGNKRSIEQGKYINKSKHGYLKDKNQHLRPDGENFILIKNAFSMRLHDNKTLAEIAEYLNANNYHRSNIKDGKKYYKMDKQRVEKILKDPVYTGVLKYGKNDAVNLIELYNFIPMVTIDEFFIINKINGNLQFTKLAKSYRKNENVKANLMRGMIICAECGESMSAGITPKKTKDGGVTRYFYYRCETNDCIKLNKSLRAKVVIDHICGFLEGKPFSSKRSYKHYVAEMNKVSQQRVIDARSTLNSFQTKKRHLLDKETKIKDMFLNDGINNETKALFESDVKTNKAELEDIEHKITKLKAYIDNSKTSILTYSDFLELMENMPKNIGLMKNMEELDYVIKKIFLNFTIKDKKVEKHTLNVPFDELDTLKVSHSAR